MHPDLLKLKRWRDQISYEENSLRLLREQRNSLAVKLALQGVSERTIADVAGISGPYINQLKQQAKNAKSD